MKKELTKAEEQIMQAIWQVEKGFAKDILEALEDPKPAYSTVTTVIRVLVQKGFVDYETYGKSNQYFPTITKEAYSKQRLDALKVSYFDGSNVEMLSFFMRKNKMNLEELEEVIRLIKSTEDE
jgi:predicted transcriptional regulator